jgi:hypothetical protein
MKKEKEVIALHKHWQWHGGDMICRQTKKKFEKKKKKRRKKSLQIPFFFLWIQVIEIWKVEKKKKFGQKITTTTYNMKGVPKLFSIFIFWIIFAKCG